MKKIIFTLLISVMGLACTPVLRVRGPTSSSGSVTVTSSSGSLVATYPSPVTAGVPFNVTVTAKDASNATDTAYTGTVTIGTTNGSATLPASATLTNGVGVFSVTLNTAGTFNVSASDGTNSISGSITVNPSGATHLVFSVQPSVTGNTDNVLVAQPVEPRPSPPSGTLTSQIHRVFGRIFLGFRKG
jgi:hypothetical protein